jgi:hypothetical protein
LVGGKLGHHLAPEHGDGVDGGLLGQSLGSGSGVNRLQDFGLLGLLLGELLVLLPLDATTCHAARFFDSTARAFAVISFLPLARTVGATAVEWAES